MNMNSSLQHLPVSLLSSGAFMIKHPSLRRTHSFHCYFVFLLSCLFDWQNLLF